jgi:hypothetical protein
MCLLSFLLGTYQKKIEYHKDQNPGQPHQNPSAILTTLRSHRMSYFKHLSLLSFNNIYLIHFHFICK